MNEEFRERNFQKESKERSEKFTDKELIILLKDTKQTKINLSKEIQKKDLPTKEKGKKIKEAKKLIPILNKLEKELNQRSKIYYEIKNLPLKITPEKKEQIESKINEIENEAIRNYFYEILKEKEIISEKETSTAPLEEKIVLEEVKVPPTPEPTPPLSEEGLEKIAKEQLEEKKGRIFWANIEGLTGEAAEKLMIPNESRNKVINSLEEIKKRYILQFIKKEWLPAHQEKIEEMGFPPKENLGDSVILQLFKKMGGDQELEKKKELVSEVLPLVILDWQEKSPTLESRLLALILLNDQLFFLEKELEEIEESKLSEEKKEEKKDLINKEIEKLFEIRKELAEKITGRDLRREAEEKIPPLQAKEKYVNDYLNFFEKEEKGWFFWKEFIIIDNSGEEEIVRKFKSEKERDDFLQNKKREREEIWDELDKRREGIIKTFIEDEIIELSPSSSKEAEEKIRKFWERIRKKLIEEEKERIKTKKEKPEEPKAAIRLEEPKDLEKEIQKQCEKAPSCPLVELLESLITNLTDKFKEDKQDKEKELLKSLKDAGLELESEDLKSKKFVRLVKDYISGLLENPEGFIAWLGEFIVFLYYKALEHLIKEAMKTK